MYYPRLHQRQTMAGKSTLPGIAQGLPTRREAEVRAPARAASMGPAPRFLSPPQPHAPGKIPRSNGHEAARGKVPSREHVVRVIAPSAGDVGNWIVCPPEVHRGN